MKTQEISTEDIFMELNDDTACPHCAFALETDTTVCKTCGTERNQGSIMNAKLKLMVMAENIWHEKEKQSMARAAEKLAATPTMPGRWRAPATRAAAASLVLVAGVMATITFLRSATAEASPEVVAGASKESASKEMDGKLVQKGLGSGPKAPDTDKKEKSKKKDEKKEKKKDNKGGKKIVRNATVENAEAFKKKYRSLIAAVKEAIGQTPEEIPLVNSSAHPVALSCLAGDKEAINTLLRAFSTSGFAVEGKGYFKTAPEALKRYLSWCDEE